MLDVHPPPSPPATRVGVPIAVLSGTALVVLAQIYVAIPLLGPVGADLGTTGATIALGTVFSVAYAVGFLVFGPLSDHVGRRAVVVPGLVVLAVLTVACAAAPSVTVLGVLRAGQGFAASTFAPVALAYLSEALPPRWRAAGIGAMSTSFLVAGILGQVVASWIAQTWVWRGVFLALGAVLMIAAAAVASVVRDPGRQHVPVALSRRFAELGRLATRRRVLLLCAAELTLLMSFVAMYTALGPHLRALGLEQTDVIGVRLVAVPAMLLALAASRVASATSARTAGILGLSVAAAGLTLQAALSSSSAGVCAGSVVFVAGIALTVPTMITLFAGAAEPARAAGMSLAGFVLFAGASLGPLVGATTSLDFAGLLVALAGVLLVAAGFLHLATRAPGTATGGAA
jgi:predicted MFS family arabinose efflux permease